MSKVWQLQEAKNKLSEVVKKAVEEGPQTLTRHGKPEAVVLSFEAYKKLADKKENLVAFLARSPLKGEEIDLKRNKDLPRGDIF